MDMAAYHFSRSDYHIRTALAGESLQTIVTGFDGAAADDIDTLRGIESVDFTDRTFVLAGAQLNQTSNVAGSRFDDVLLQSANTGQVLFARMESGSFQEYGIVTAPLDSDWKAVATGDVNPEDTGGAETFIQHLPSGAIYYATLDTGTTSWGVVSASLTGDWKLRAVADINGDASADAVVQHTGTGTIFYADMQGGTFQEWNVVSSSLTPGWTAVGAGDITRDGFADVVIRDGIGNTILFADMAGGQFSGWKVVTAGLPGNWGVAGVGDVTGDGYADVIVQDETNGTTFYADMTGGALHHWGVVSASLTADWLAQALADVDNDGDRDVVFWNDASGDTVYAEVNGGGINVPSWGAVASNIGTDWQVV
jgi:hypothetical protein